MICLFGGNGSEEGISMKEFTCFLRNVLIEFIDSIYIIYITGFDFKETKRSTLTDNTYVWDSPLKNPDMPHAKMEGIPLLNLSEHAAIRFWTRLTSLKKKMYERDDNDRMKRLLDCIDYNIPWMILTDKDGEIVTKKWERYCFLVYKEYGRES